MWHFLLLSRISNWIFRNQLLINSDKTKLIIFGSRGMVSKAQDLRVSLLWKEINSVVSGKDLGVVLDPSLICNDHVASTASSCKARLGQINRVKQAFATETFTMIIINALVFGKLYYCCNVWRNTSERNLAARIVSNKRKYDHISPIL